jgi:lysophospholipase L1-like esterase
MKNILCFGDSNTWGYDPVATANSPLAVRHAPQYRWTGVLGAELGSGFRIIEEGQNGRTTAHHDPTAWACRNARVYLPSCLESQKPLDLVILMLGTNDLKSMFGVAPGEIATCAGILVKMILQSDCGPNGKAPKVLLVCPPAIGDLSNLPELAAKLEGARDKSLRLPAYFHAIARQLGVHYLNSQEIVVPSPVDGIHLDTKEHLALARAIAAEARRILASTEPLKVSSAPLHHPGPRG